MPVRLSLILRHARTNYRDHELAISQQFAGTAKHRAQFELSVDTIESGIANANNWLETVYVPELEAAAKRQAELDERAKAKGKPLSLIRTVRS